jgi:GxxExxY protein
MDHHTSLTQKVIGCAIEVHWNLGPGLLEIVYETCLFRELAFAGIGFVRQRSCQSSTKANRSIAN